MTFLEEFTYEFIRENGRAPTMVELWLAVEARSSIALDRDERAQTISLEE